MIRRATAAIIATAALLLAGCGSDADQPAQPETTVTTDPAIAERAEMCEDALADVVEAIETSWMTASMAVTEAQNAADSQLVDDCLDR